MNNIYGREFKKVDAGSGDDIVTTSFSNDQNPILIGGDGYDILRFQYQAYGNYIDFLNVSGFEEIDFQVGRTGTITPVLLIF